MEIRKSTLRNVGLFLLCVVVLLAFVMLFDKIAVLEKRVDTLSGLNETKIEQICIEGCIETFRGCVYDCGDEVACQKDCLDHHNTCKRRC